MTSEYLIITCPIITCKYLLNTTQWLVITAQCSMITNEYSNHNSNQLSAIANDYVLITCEFFDHYSLVNFDYHLWLIMWSIVNILYIYWSLVFNNDKNVNFLESIFLDFFTSYLSRFPSKYFSRGYWAHFLRRRHDSFEKSRRLRKRRSDH